MERAVVKKRTTRAMRALSVLAAGLALLTASGCFVGKRSRETVAYWRNDKWFYPGSSVKGIRKNALDAVRDLGCEAIYESGGKHVAIIGARLPLAWT